MKRHLIFLIIISCSLRLFGQQTDSTSKSKIYHHYISINPLNTLFCQQAGITYEFKTKRIGFEITSGYFYRNDVFYIQSGVEGIKNKGELGSYNGSFIIPQLNLYLNKINETGNCYYVSFKGVYRKLHSDSSETRFWSWEDGGNDYWLYRKQDDKLRISGLFFLLCAKHYEKHYFAEAYLGPGMLDIKHDLIIVGQYVGEDVYNESNINPAKKEIYQYRRFSLSFGLNLGLKF